MQDICAHVNKESKGYRTNKRQGLRLMWNSETSLVKFKREAVKTLDSLSNQAKSFQTPSELPMLGCTQECHQEGWRRRKDQGKGKAGAYSTQVVRKSSKKNNHHCFRISPRNCPKNPNFFQLKTARLVISLLPSIFNHLMLRLSQERVHPKFYF